MDSEKKPSITLTPNGPYIVKALKNCSNKKGLIETTETMAFCRCGASANKPYCDGSHTKIGFSSAKLDGRLEDRQKTYKGKKVTINDNRGICAHAGYCTDKLSSVFRMNEEPWINPDAASVEEIIAVIQKCPSGALGYSVDDTEKPSRDETPAIMIASNGPYAVSGGIDLAYTAWGEGASKEEYTLCRCGASKNKPFCDGSHWSVKFHDDKN